MSFFANLLPPAVSDGTPMHKAALLRAVLIYMFALALLFGLTAGLLLPDNRLRGVVIAVPIGLNCLVAYLLMRRGQVSWAGASFLLGMGIIGTLLAVTSGGSHSTSFSNYMCIVLMAGLLFGLRGSFISTTLCLAAEAGVIYAETHGLLPSNQVHHTMASLLVTNAIFLGWIALLVFQYTRTIGTATHNLGERVKELTALHATTQALQTESWDTPKTLERLVTLIPPAYQFPEFAAARVRLGTMQAITPRFDKNAYWQISEFKTSDGLHGSIEVGYRDGFPGNPTHPFLNEEQDLLDTLAELLRAEYERRVAHTALSVSESRLRELFDTARDTVYRLSPDGRIESLNPAFETITGWKREEWIGKAFAALMHPDDLPRVAQYFRAALSGEESPLYEARVRSKSGEYVNAEFLGVPRRSRDGIIGVLGIARDVTERRRLEEQLQRTQRLDSIGMLAGGIAHDLNNVLTPILLSSELLGKRLEDEKTRRMAASIFTAATRGSEIVKQILTFSRGGGGHKQPQQLRKLVQEMETFVRDTFPRNIEVRFDAPSTLPFILADSTQIHQVFLNLCVNARDAMPEGGRLSVSATTEHLDAIAVEGAPAAGEYVVLTVTDTGTGIPAEIRDKIFDPFFTTKKAGSGTGLGLSTCFSIVRAHGGFIRLASEPGRGTEFRVFFPTVEAGIETEQEEPAALSGNGETVLVVDDEQASLFFVREILETSGFSVLIAHDGIEALDVFGRMAPGSVKLVVTDIDMPRMNGIELAQSLRERDSKVKVLLTSGSASLEEQAEKLEAGPFLAKPYTSDLLLKTLGKLMQSGRGSEG
jgi:two-component system cell cycle sensor histidine kinase/response regulator CckA